MKIAIHHRPGSFSDYWIEYCKAHNIAYKIVDAYSNDIIQQLTDCDAFMWHHHHAIHKDSMMARNLLITLQNAGKIVFPNVTTSYTFDDKVAQKYQLESIGAPLVRSYAFYDKATAMIWAGQTEFPKVFKLRGGAGASNVKLVNTKAEALRLINRAFGHGFGQRSVFAFAKEQFMHMRQGHISAKQFVKAVGKRILQPSDFIRWHGKEAGYIYFQDFLPDNDYDTRVIVVGDRAIAIKRMCRKNDFRASGSGNIRYAKDEINPEMVKLSFDIAQQLCAQCIAYDWVYDECGKPCIVEIGYGFTAKGYFSCPGYWTSDMEWHNEKPDFCGWMVEDIITKYNEAE